MSFPPGTSGGGGPFSGRPRNTLGFSLGAVGGPRGTGAGVTRILLQYVTQYDKGQLEQLTKDLSVLTAQQTAANQQLLAASTRQKAIEDEINAAKVARGNLDSQAQKRLTALLDVQARARAEESSLGRVTAATTAELIKREAAFRQISGLSSQENAAIINEKANQAALNVAKQETLALSQGVAEREAQINGIMEQGVAIATMRAQLASQIKNLFLGAVGGVVGGAIIGAVLYQPLQNFMNAISEGFQDMVDPARHAREEIEGVAAAVDKFADAGGSRFDAAVEHIKSLGLIGQGLGLNPQTLSDAAKLEEIGKAIEQANADLDVQQHYLDLANEKIDLQAANFAKAAANGRDVNEVVREMVATGQAARGDAAYLKLALEGNTAALHLLANEGNAWAQSMLDQGQAAIEAALGLDTYGDAAAKAAQAAADLNDELNQNEISRAFDAAISGIKDELDSTINGIRDTAETDIDAIRQHAADAVNGIQNDADARIKALQRQSQNLEVIDSRRTKNIQAALDALKDAGPSQRTQELSNLIDKLNSQQDKAEFRAQLADIAEQKRQILLRERLKLTNEQINLDDYQGKDRIIAIDALLDRQNKINDAQERFNQLLDIQYNIQKGVRRQQGETIQDFLARRAQYYRGLLQQAAELQNKGDDAELQADKERTQTAIDLRELEQKRRKLIEDRAREQYMAGLKDELQASQERDRKELESRRETLQKELAASKKADQERLQARRQAIQDEIDKIRQAASDEIDQVNRRRDADIRARETARDNAIAAAQRVAEVAIAAEQRRADAVKAWASYAETQRLIEAFNGAQDVAQLNRFAGALAGANFSASYIQAQMQALGVDPLTQAAVLANLGTLRTAYQNRLNTLQPTNQSAPTTMQPAWMYPHQDGGAFLLRNSQQSPFGRNIRYGEDGKDEIGVILSNAVVRKLDQQGSSGTRALFNGDMVINSTEDPYRARGKWRHEINSLIDERLSN